MRNPKEWLEVPRDLYKRLLKKIEDLEKKNDELREALEQTTLMIESTDYTNTMHRRILMNAELLKETEG